MVARLKPSAGESLTEATAEAPDGRAVAGDAASPASSAPVPAATPVAVPPVGREGRCYRGLVLDRFQEIAIRYVEEGHSVLVSAPTGTGKTLIADFLVEEILSLGGRVIYTAPIKALSNQKFREYTRLFGYDKVGLLTGDLVINREAPLRIMTTEILRNMLLEREPLQGLRGVILDEIHFLDDAERGTVWEEVLIHLPSDVRILGLSATLANLDEFAAWLSMVRGERVKVVREAHRAVPLTHHLANSDAGLLGADEFREGWQRWRREHPDAAGERDGDGRRGRPARHRARRGRRGGAPGPATQHHDVVGMLRPRYLPLLYFVFSRKQTEEFARELASLVPDSFLGVDEQRRVEERLEAFSREYPYVLTDEHRAMYCKGIAFHHAGIHVATKALVEELYEQRLIHVLYCTSTFALGINMPARTVVFDSIMKFDGRAVVPLTVRQYMQKAGRAGRRGIDHHGHVVIRSDFDEFGQQRDEIKRLHGGRYEPVSSSFNLSFNSVVCLLRQQSLDEVRSIVERSFLSFHLRRQAEEIGRRLPAVERVIAELRPSSEDGWQQLSRPQRRRLKREEHRLRNLQHDLERAQGWTWEAFLRKLEILRKIGYLDEENRFLAGAEVLLHIQIEEILVTELILSGILNEVPVDVFFGILTGLVQELPRSAHVDRPRDRWWYDLFRRLNRIRHSEPVRLAEAAGTEPIAYSPYLMPLGTRWARGDSLAAILADVESPTDVAGDLVGAFRRAKDLASQILEVHRGDPARTQEIRELMRSVTRDEVEVID